MTAGVCLALIFGAFLNGSSPSLATARSDTAHAWKLVDGRYSPAAVQPSALMVVLAASYNRWVCPLWGGGCCAQASLLDACPCPPPCTVVSINPVTGTLLQPPLPLPRVSSPSHSPVVMHCSNPCLQVGARGADPVGAGALG